MSGEAMDRTRIAEQLAEMLVGRRSHPLGVAGLMIEDEIEKGRQPLQPGGPAPFEFPAEDWVFPAVVSLSEREVRLIAILAQTPGRGAFSRLVANIRGAGLTPVIVCPVGVTMPAILKRWRWRKTVVGRGFDATDEWRPPIREETRGART